MSMFAEKNGKLEPIPAAHEQVLARYRVSMPLVHEPQYVGDHTLSPLIDDEPEGAPMPSEAEVVARKFAQALKDRRLRRPGRGPDHASLMATAVEEYVADEYKNPICGAEDPTNPTAEELNEAAAFAAYAARRAQLFAAAAFRKVTGQSMPTGALPTPYTEPARSQEEAEWLAEEWPPLPPVGCPSWCDGAHDGTDAFHTSRQIMMVPPAAGSVPPEQALVPQMKASLMVPTAPGERACIYLRLEDQGDRSVELDLKGADDVLAELDAYRAQFQAMRDQLAQASQEAGA